MGHLDLYEKIKQDSENKDMTGMLRYEIPKRARDTTGMIRYKIPDPPENECSETKSITEAMREVKILKEADVIVAGGGPGGFAAAVSAARMGAKTVLLERYGHLGGMATGGLVNIIPNLSDMYGKQYIGGICQELIDRMTARDATFAPDKADWGTTDEKIIGFYLNSNFRHFYVRKNKEGNSTLLYTALIDPEVGKDEINAMVSEAGVKLLLHSWVTEPIMEGNTVKGVIFESKSGRQAITGKVVIDSTGDGDLLPLAGVETASDINPQFRIANLAFAFWVGGVDLMAYDKFKSTRPLEHAKLAQELYDRELYINFFKGLLKHQESVVWFHPHFSCKCQTDVEEMTRMDVEARKKAMQTWEFYKKNMPGFEKSFIVKTAPQLGTTGGRRLVGEYVLSENDLNSTQPFSDTIAVFPNNDRNLESPNYDRAFIPYRSILPQKVEGLLVACRAFSSDDKVNDNFNLVPHCMCLGQAAGIAAALAARDNISARDVPYAVLKENLLKQGAILP